MNQITPELLRAVIQQESGGDPNALSPTGAAGIMQIMPATARDPGFGVTPLQGWDGEDPRTAPVEEQIRFGKEYLEAMKNRYGGDQSVALAAYNAGPGSVDKYGGVPPFEETQNYVQNINANAPPQNQLQPAPNSDWRSRAKPLNQRPTQTTQTNSSWRNRATPIEFNKPTLGQKMKRTIDNNTAQMERSAEAYVAGEQTMAETAFQQGTAFASNVPDLLFDAAAHVTPEFVKDAGGAVLKQVGKLPTFDGGTLGEGVPRELNELAERHPRLARNTQAVLDTASFAPTVKAADAVAKGGKAIAQKGGQVFAKKAPSQTAASLKEMAQKAYQQADEIGAQFTPGQVGVKFDRSLKQQMPKAIAGKVLTTEDKFLLRHLNEYKGLNRQSLSLNDVQRIDQSLTSKITANFLDPKTGLPDANGLKLMKVQENLREIVDSVPSNAANDALVNGRNLWRAQTILNELDTIAERASMTKNVGNSLRLGYKSLYNNKKRLRGWPKEAKELLKKAATPTITDDALQLISSRLPAIIMGGTGNVLGAATAHVVGASGRGLKAGIAAKRGAKVQRSIIDDAIGNMREVSVPTKSDIPLMLSSPAAIAKPMSDQQIKQAQKKLNKQNKSVTTDEIIELQDKTKRGR